MKTLKRFSAVVSAAALLAVAFTGCNNSFAGTELNYNEVESSKVATQTNPAGDTQSLTSASITSVLTGNVGYTGKASTRTSFTVTVTNNATNTRVNLASAKEAINFYAVTSGTATTNKVRSAVLPKTLFSEKENNNKTAEFIFEVDTSSIPTSDVAVFVDATKLKDKQGTLILNLDNNYKRGEATDNYKYYITVDSSKPATTGVDEEFCHEWNPITAVGVARVNNTSDGKLTGEYEVRVTPNAYPKASPTDAATVNKDLAATLNTIYALRTREPGATSTSTKALSFSWDETNGYYKATAGNLVPGTKYDIVVTKKDISSLAPTWYTTYYGHPAFIADDAFGSKTATGAGTADVYVNSPDYIVEPYSATAVTWNPTQKNAAAIASAQQNFLTASLSGRVFTVTVADNEKLEFESYKDFMVVDSNSGVEYKLPIEYRVKLNDADNTNPNRLVKLEIEITNKNISLNNAKLYVGSGVVLKNNPTNSTQKKFGKYKDAADGIHSGYVALN